jgi:hypothetical protein
MPARRILLTQTIRLGSRRLPGKLLERVGDRPLVDYGLELLARAAREPDCQVLIGLSPAEERLRGVVEARGLEWVDMGDAVEADDYNGAVAGWTDRLHERADWVIDCNLCCRPFLRWETVETILNQTAITRLAFTATIRERGIIWGKRWPAPETDTVMIGEGQVADTRRNPQYQRLAHLCYAHPAAIWTEDQLATATFPFAIELQPAERIDVDTRADLDFARLVHRGLATLQTMPYC